jgi:3-oxoacyl-[acyl-carrier-protein] synthase-3
MSDPRAGAGIVSLAVYIPRSFHTAEYVAAHSQTPAQVIRTKIGWYQKTVPGPEDHTVTMGLKAARKALFYSALPPEDIQLVIWCGEEVKEYRSWPAGPKIQKELGLRNAWSFDMQQRCGTSLVALKLARDMIRADESIRNVLVVMGYRNSDLIDYRNPRLRWMYYLAAGGAACILQRNYPRNQILESHFISDGSFAFDVYVPAGGAVEPMTAAGLENHRQYLDLPDPEGMKERLEKKSLANWLLCIDKALEKSGCARRDVAYLDTLLVKRSAHDALVRELGLQPHQTRYLADLGHHGQNDQILSLDLAIEEGKLRDGDIVLMISAGIGYAWNALVMRWGQGPAPAGGSGPTLSLLQPGDDLK